MPVWVTENINSKEFDYLFGQNEYDYPQLMDENTYNHEAVEKEFEWYLRR